MIIIEELLKDLEKSIKPSYKECIEMYDKNYQIGFRDNNAVAFANAIIDLQSHLICAKLVHHGIANITNDEKKKLVEHLKELKHWVVSYTHNAITYVQNTIEQEDEYANKTKEELIEELKKLKKK